MANRAFGWNLKNHRKQMTANKKRLAYRKFIIRASEGSKAATKAGLAYPKFVIRASEGRKAAMKTGLANG